MTGYTISTDFPTLNPFQTAQGGADVFVTKLSASGSSLVYSTHLGGSLEDVAYVTVTQAAAPGHLRLFPAGSREPGASSINYVVGVTRANNGVVRLGSGNLNVSCRQPSGTAHAILDVNGYFE